MGNCRKIKTLILSLLLSFNVMMIVSAYNDPPEDDCGEEARSLFLGTLFFGGGTEASQWCCKCPYPKQNKTCHYGDCPIKVIIEGKIYENCVQSQSGVCHQKTPSQDAICICYYSEEDYCYAYFNCDYYFPTCALS